MIQSRAFLTSVLTACIAFATPAAGAASPGTSMLAALKPGLGSMPEPTAYVVPVQGTRLSLVPPPHFVEATTFSGFEHSSEPMTIVITEIPVADPQRDRIEVMERDFTAESFKPQGVELLSKERGIHPALPSLLMRCEFAMDGAAFGQWIYLIESGNGRLAQLQVTGPASSVARHETALLQAMRSVQWRDIAAPFQIAYSLDLPRGWSLAGQAGNVDIYRPGGAFKSPHEPSLLVLNLNRGILPERRDEFIRDFNLKRSNLAEQRILESHDLQIDGVAAHISYVSAVDTRTSRKVIKQYCFLFLAGRLMLIEAERGTVLTREAFEKTVRSWQRTMPGATRFVFH